jgi:hypothetical protein
MCESYRARAYTHVSNTLRSLHVEGGDAHSRLRQAHRAHIFSNVSVNLIFDVMKAVANLLNQD